MKITRRQFLKWCGISAFAMGLGKDTLLSLEKSLVEAGSKPAVIWLQGAGCSGCTISLLNTIEAATIDDVLLNVVDMKYHHNLMTAAGDLAISAIDDTVNTHDGNFILVIEGAVPTGENGAYCILTEKNGVPWTMQDAVLELAPRARYVIAAGTCASYGGIPKASPNPTDVVRLDKSLLRNKTVNPVINLPGCPVHPYTITKTIVDLLVFGMPLMDREGRPLEVYDKKVHARCPNRGSGQATELGQVNSCYKSLGCQGAKSNNNCPVRKWNNKVNWCIASGHPCIACANPDFPATSVYNFTDDPSKVLVRK